MSAELSSSSSSSSGDASSPVRACSIAIGVLALPRVLCVHLADGFLEDAEVARWAACSRQLQANLSTYRLKTPISLEQCRMRQARQAERTRSGCALPTLAAFGPRTVLVSLPSVAVSDLRDLATLACAATTLVLEVMHPDDEWRIQQLQEQLPMHAWRLPPTLTSIRTVAAWHRLDTDEAVRMRAAAKAASREEDDPDPPCLQISTLPLPPTLTELHLEHWPREYRINRELQRDGIICTLPRSLMRLHMCAAHIDPDCELRLPDELESVIEMDFSVAMAVRFPTSVRELTIQFWHVTHDQALCLPRSLHTLVLSTRSSYLFQSCADLPSWPSSLTDLDFAGCVHPSKFALADLALPDSLRRLRGLEAKQLELAADNNAHAGLATALVRLPASLTELDLWSTDRYLLRHTRPAQIVWPPELRKLDGLPLFADQADPKRADPAALASLSLPDTITDLRVEGTCPLHFLRFPAQLQRCVVHCSNGVREGLPSISGVEWNGALCALTLGYYKRELLDWRPPAGLDTLRLLSWTQLLSELRLPPALRVLQLPGWDGPVGAVETAAWPPTLEEVEFSHGQSLSDWTPPPNLRKLNLGHTSYPSMEPRDIRVPPSLAELKLKPFFQSKRSTTEAILRSQLSFADAQWSGMQVLRIDCHHCKPLLRYAQWPSSLLCLDVQLCDDSFDDFVCSVQPDRIPAGLRRLMVQCLMNQSVLANPHVPIPEQLRRLLPHTCALQFTGV